MDLDRLEKRLKWLKVIEIVVELAILGILTWAAFDYASREAWTEGIFWMLWVLTIYAIIFSRKD